MDFVEDYRYNVWPVVNWLFLQKEKDIIKIEKSRIKIATRRARDKNKGKKYTFLADVYLLIVKYEIFVLASH